MNYLYLCICTSAKCMSVEVKVYLFIWTHNFRFSMSLSLSPNSLYCQTTDCTEGGGLTREHCKCTLQNSILLLKIKCEKKKCIITYHLNTFVVAFCKIFLQWNVFNSECYSLKTQLSSNVHSSQLHFHSNKFHSTNTSVRFV